MLFGVFAVLLALVALMLLAPAKAEQEMSESAVSYYRNQLKKLKAERSTMDDDSFAEAELEVQRRLLAADREAQRTETSAAPAAPGIEGAGRARRASLIAVILVIVAAVGLYGAIGSWTVAEAPATARHSLEDTVIPSLGVTLGQRLGEIRARLEADPSRKDDWIQLARLSGAARNYTESAGAYAVLAQMEPKEPAWLVSQYEALLELYDGNVVPASSLVLDQLFRVAPEHPAAHFYLGLGYARAGETERAHAVWSALKARSAADAPWMPSLDRALAQLDGAVASKTGPDGETVAATAESVAQMDPEEQAAFIRSMADRLAGRLASNPDDPVGWLMLARTRKMLDGEAAAKEVLEEALTKLDGTKAANIKEALDKLAAGEDF